MIENLQFLRAFASINVVYLHVLIGSESYGRASLISDYLGGWGNNGVDIFFVISGFVMIYSQVKNPKTVINFYKSRLIRIVPIYWILTIFIISLFFLFPDLFKTFNTDLQKSLSSFLFISQLIINDHPVINVGWTLEWEMLFYFIFGLAILFKTLYKMVWFNFIVMFIIFTISKNLFFLEFFIGVIIGYIYLKYKISTNKGFTFLIFGIIFLLLSINPNSSIRDYDRFIIWGLPSALIVLGAVYSKPIKNHLLFYLGNASYSIYLVQVLTVPAFFKFINILDISLDNNFLSILCLIFSISFGCIFHSMIEKKLRFK